MGSKRINGEGSVYRYGKGWQACITIGIDGAGRQIRKRRNAQNQREALLLLEELRDQYFGQNPIIESDVTVAEFLESWLDGFVRVEREESTHENYATTVRLHIAPHVGRYRLDKLTPVHVQNMLTTMERRKVGSRTRQNAYAILKAALSHAFRLGMVRTNAAGPVQKPRHERQPIRPLSVDEVALLVTETETDRLRALYVLAVSTGMRQEELFGLRWKNVDFDKGTVFVCEASVQVAGRIVTKKPKSKAGTRTIELTDSAIDALRHRQSVAMQEGNAASELVFCAPEGGHVYRTTFAQRYWRPLLSSLKIEHRGFHHLRHTYATIALSSGVPVNEVAAIMGHAKPSTTMDIYGQVLETYQARSVAVMSKLLG